MEALFALVILFDTPDGGHHTGVMLFASAADCEAAKAPMTKTLIEQAGATEVGMACTSALKVAKLTVS